MKSLSNCIVSKRFSFIPHLTRTSYIPQDISNSALVKATLWPPNSSFPLVLYPASGIGYIGQRTWWGRMRVAGCAWSARVYALVNSVASAPGPATPRTIIQVQNLYLFFLSLSLFSFTTDRPTDLTQSTHPPTPQPGELIRLPRCRVKSRSISVSSSLSSSWSS